MIVPTLSEAQHSISLWSVSSGTSIRCNRALARFKESLIFLNSTLRAMSIFSMHLVFGSLLVAEAVGIGNAWGDDEHGLAGHWDAEYFCNAWPSDGVRRLPKPSSVM